MGEELRGAPTNPHQLLSNSSAHQQLVRSPVKRALIGLFKCGLVEHTEWVDDAILVFVYTWMRVY